MKKFILLFLCLTIVSCFVEPKKENLSILPEVVSTNNTYENEKPIIDSALIKETDTVVGENFKNPTESKSTITSRLEIIDNINLILKNRSKMIGENRLTFISDKRNLMLFSSYEFNLDNVYVVYVNRDYNDGFGANRVSIECQKNSSGSNCMYDTVNVQYISGYTFPLKTKEDCLYFVEQFNSLYK